MVTIETYEKKAHILELLKIVQINRGSGYKSVKELEETLRRHTVFVARYDGEIAGFVAFRMCPLEEAILVEEAVNHFEKRLTFAVGGHLVGSITLLVVDREFQKKKVGSKLIQKVVEKLNGKVSAVFLQSWNNPTNPAVEPLMKSQGFEPWKVYENFYRKHKVGIASQCPVCPGICQCSMTVFYRLLGNKCDE
ncbi:Acetyltransferase (GNAT) domain-containing protein [Tindallia magadiensis]|uniref:Acetyltransferase (GNAT) domain-containing protein n=1 Tax=Tindallia magadiensis TaxID=69895 RepID=A0A1I3FIH1_9FIRM|nr:GNAT family N-acetyltransferase [Tindallia magadiensis]SFI10701.1 Acetyltransferase (GNAT) domain-containing protein [Tindallia magadiensis]